ncbi:MAG: ribonuclease III [Phycisphaerae bacterium]
MDPSVLQRCQELIDYAFSDIDLLTLALTHSSVAATRAQSNERLEFLGDAVLGLVVCQELYEREGDLTEGQMTKIKSAVVSRQTCADVVEALGITELLFMGKGISRSGSVPQSVSAAVLESIIGAVYLDGGLEAASGLILRLMRPHIEECLANEHQRNYKSLLQQHAQRTWGATPEYVLLDEKGPDHSKCFEIAVVIDGRTFPSAWGMSKKEAEQDAARLALEALDLLPAEKAEADQDAPREDRWDAKPV